STKMNARESLWSRNVVVTVLNDCCLATVIPTRQREITLGICSKPILNLLLDFCLTLARCPNWQICYWRHSTRRQSIEDHFGFPISNVGSYKFDALAGA